MSTKLGNVEHTQRGFEHIDFADRYDRECYLQQSSLAEFETPGTSAIWLGQNDGHSMHLDRELVQSLVNHLQAWLDIGSLVVTEPEIK